MDIKKVLLVFVLALFVGTVNAASLRLDSLRTECFDKLNIPDAGTRTITTAIGNRLINQAINEICTDFPALEKIDTIIVYKEDEGGVLPSDFVALKNVFLMDGYTVRIPLKIVGADTLRKLFNSEGQVKHDKSNPMSIAYAFKYARRLMLLPKYAKDTAAIDSFLVYYYATDAQLTNDTDSTLIEKRFRGVLISYATSEMATIKNDYEKAAYYRRLYDQAKGVIQ